MKVYVVMNVGEYIKGVDSVSQLVLPIVGYSPDEAVDIAVEHLIDTLTYHPDGDNIKFHPEQVRMGMAVRPL